METKEFKRLVDRSMTLKELKDNSIADNLEYQASLSRIKEAIKEKEKAKVRKRRGILNVEGVYFIINPSTNRMYIGRSINMNDRIVIHKNEIKRGIHVNKVLQEDFNVYAKDIKYFYIITKQGDSPLLESVFINYCTDNGIKLYNGSTIRMQAKDYNKYINLYRRELRAVRGLLNGEQMRGRGGVFSLDNEVVTRE
tara:strand:- start:152 stop:739 length:588 start_codon:yes stop_codon:yes gene_type:complete